MFASSSASHKSVSFCRRGALSDVSACAGVVMGALAAGVALLFMQMHHAVHRVGHHMRLNVRLSSCLHIARGSAPAACAGGAGAQLAKFAAYLLTWGQCVKSLTKGLTCCLPGACELMRAWYLVPEDGVMHLSLLHYNCFAAPVIMHLRLSRRRWYAAR